MPKRCTFFRLQVYERVRSEICHFGLQKGSKGLTDAFYCCEIVETSSFFVMYSYFKDSAFTAVKRVDAKFLTWYVKEVSFVNRRYTNWYPASRGYIFALLAGMRKVASANNRSYPSRNLDE